MSVKDLNYRAAVGKANQTSSTRMASANVWSECPWFELTNGTKDGFTYFDDFLGTYVQAANAVAASTTLNQPWVAFTNATAGSTIASGVSPTDAIGTMVLNATTANEGVNVGLFASKGTSGTSAPIPALISTNRAWFEVRIKTSTITTEDVGFYVGFGEVGRLITLGLIATGGAAAAAIDQIGWFYPTAATTALSSTHGNGTATILSASAGTVAADTYTKLGFYWNGTTGTWYQDGVAHASTVTTSTSQFPAGAYLAFYMAAQCGSTAGDSIVTVDWVKVAFERTATSTT